MIGISKANISLKEYFNSGEDRLSPSNTGDPDLLERINNLRTEIATDGIHLIPNRENPNHFKFDQNVLIEELANLNADPVIAKSDQGFPKLVKVDKKHNGLCELICNKILLEGWMDESKKPEFLNKNITLQNLNDDKIVKSHLLNVFSLFRKILAKLFQIYPDNLLSRKEQKSFTVKKTDNHDEINKEICEINKYIFETKLKEIEVGTVLKVETIFCSTFSFSGHSTLLKKDSEDSYTYFDPNSGTTTNLNLKDLYNQMNFSIEYEDASEIYLMKADDFLKRLEKKKII